MKNDVKDDIEFLLSFVPAIDPKDVYPDLMPMFYVTTTYEGDIKLAKRVQEIVRRYEIDVNSINDIFDEE